MSDVAAAVRIVDASGIDNAVIMIDAWHVQRGTTTFDDLAELDPSSILGIQLCDAPAVPATDLLHETMHARRLTGEGDGDVAGLLRVLTHLGPAVATRRAAEILRAVVAEARRDPAEVLGSEH